MGMPKPVAGRFGNSMEYARWGDTSENVLYIPGGLFRDKGFATDILRYIRGRDTP